MDGKKGNLVSLSHGPVVFLDVVVKIALSIANQRKAELVNFYNHQTLKEDIGDNLRRQLQLLFPLVCCLFCVLQLLANWCETQSLGLPIIGKLDLNLVRLCV